MTPYAGRYSRSFLRLVAREGALIDAGRFLPLKSIRAIKGRIRRGLRR